MPDQKILNVVRVFSLIVIVIICVSIWKLTPVDETIGKSRKSSDLEQKSKKYVQYDEWLNGVFDSKDVYPEWLTDDEIAYVNGDGAIMRQHIGSQAERELLKATAWNGLMNPKSISVSADLEYVAITYQHIDAFVHYKSTFSVAFYSTQTSLQVDIPNFTDEGIQKIKWAPNEHKIAYVQDYNVYIVQDFSVSPVAITTDGEEIMMNGIADWGYSYEVTNDNALLWWSPNGTYLAFAKINQTDVKMFEFPYYGGSQYPTMLKLSYPKPGWPIATTKTMVVDTRDTNHKTIELEPSEKVKNWVEYYLNSALWRSDDVFSPTWRNRYGNESILETCLADTSSCSHLSNMEDYCTTGWVGNYKPADAWSTGKNETYLSVESDESGCAHLVIIDAVKNTKKWLTSGNFEVTDTSYGFSPIFFYDLINDWAYFTSTENPENNEGLPRIRHLWRVRTNGDNLTKECISCDLNNVYPNRCNWVIPSFSPNGYHVIINCGGTANGAPISTLHSISELGDVNFVRVVENNDDLLTNLDIYHFRTREYGELSLSGIDGTFYYNLHKPPNFDENKKYPMLVQVYSGPSQAYSSDLFETDWARGYIASSELDILVMTFDGRGSGFQGDDIRYSVYRNLGHYEPLDQIEATKKLIQKYSFIDADRIAIWGRSYGGYAAARTIEEDDDSVFKCGFSVAPVTDWLSYHSSYTERFLGSPVNDNAEGYNKSSAIQKLHNIGKHYFVIVQGTSDENVQFLHAARLSKALIEEDIDFSAYFAADENHRFTNGVKGNGHHYKLLTNHLKICFGL